MPKELFINKFNFQSLLNIALLIGCSWQSIAAEVNVYSGRQEALIKPLLDNFTAETGIKVNLVTGKADALLSRIKAEGQFTPADVVILADIGRLVRAKEMGITQAISSSKVLNLVDSQWQDSDGHWLALTKRARPIMIKKGDTQVSSISSMFELSNAKYRNKICVRSSSNIYNQSMVSALIEIWGEAKTLAWAKGFVKNFARKPKGGDRDQIKAMVAGECAIAIANTYYLGGMLASKDKETQAIAKQVSVVWPDQESSGVHINVSGAAIIPSAKNKTNAETLLAFMLSSESQKWYGAVNHEYPVVEGVEYSPELSSFGQFTAQKITLDKVGENNAKALMLMDKAGWK